MIQLSRKQRLLLALLAGLLMVFSFPFTGSIPYLMFISWIPLLLIKRDLIQQRKKSWRVFFQTYLSFFIYNIGATWWIWNASPGGAIFAFTLNALIMAIVFQFAYIIEKRTNSFIGNLALICFWIAFEFIHYHWELSWPWLNLGNVFSVAPFLVQWYEFTGVLGGTLWILLINILLFEILFSKRYLKNTWKISKIKLISVSIVLLFPISISIFQYVNYQDVGKDVEVVVTQPNVDPYNEKFVGSVNDQLDKICDLADIKVSEKTEFVLAPETALPFEFYEDEIQRSIYYHYLLNRKAEWDGPALLIGASTKKYFKEKNSRASRKIYGGPGYEEFYNSSMLLNEYDQPKFVHKSKLVLGVEKVPFSNVFPFLEELSINNGGTSGTLGIEEESQVLKANGTVFAPVVCYESIYGGFIAKQIEKGAELIFVITNDGWWGDTPGYKQHLAFSSLRAIENRKSVARSANTGTSCFINQRGDVLETTTWWKEAAISETIKKNDVKTIYSQLGDYLGWLAVVFSIGILIWSIYVRTVRIKIKAH